MDLMQERFPAKWRPVRVKKTRQIKNLEPRSDSIGTEKALGTVFKNRAIVGFLTDSGRSQILVWAHAGTAWGSARPGIERPQWTSAPELGSFLLSGRFLKQAGIS